MANADDFDSQAISPELQKALEAMAPGEVIFARRCACPCRRIQGFSMGSALAPSWDKPLEFRATGAWYEARRLFEHEAGARLEVEIADSCRRGGTPGDALAGREDETLDAPWHQVGDKAVCYAGHAALEAKRASKTIEELL